MHGPVEVSHGKIRVRLVGAWPQRIVMLQTDEGRAELAKLYGIDAFLEACEADAASQDGGLAHDGT